MRRRPMRRGRLTVPPAPGMRPSRTSGSEMRVSGVATTRPAKAASSIPEPATSTVEVDDRAVGHLGQESRRTSGQAQQVGRRRVAPGSELVEVAATAERGPGTVESHRGDRRVEHGDVEGLDQGVPHRRVEGVVPVRPVEGDDQFRRPVAPPAPPVRPGRPGVGLADRTARTRTRDRPGAGRRRWTRPRGLRTPTGRSVPRSSTASVIEARGKDATVRVRWARAAIPSGSRPTATSAQSAPRSASSTTATTTAGRVDSRSTLRASGRRREPPGVHHDQRPLREGVAVVSAVGGQGPGELGAGDGLGLHPPEGTVGRP